MNIIERLKNNKEAFGLMSAEMQDVARKIGREYFYRYGVGVDGPSWLSGEGSGKMVEKHVYHLRSDYVCQHEHWMGLSRICSWCGAEVPQKEVGK
jgi:hypothetical protein